MSAATWISRKRWELAQSALYFAAFLVAFDIALRFGGDEFSGGTLVRSNDNGSWLFLIAWLITPFQREVGAAAALVGSFLSAFLQLYLIHPALVMRFPFFEWTVPFVPNFPPDPEARLGVFLLAVSAAVSAIVLFRAVRRAQQRASALPRAGAPGSRDI